jgi:inner membrane protein
VPTILSHPAVPVTLGMALGNRAIPRKLLAAGVIASIVPDIDVIAFRFDVPFDAALAHRGLTHSLAVALCGALLCALLARRLGCAPWIAGLFVAASMASHGLLDAATDGGRGIMLLWPFSDERCFWPVRPIPVSPIGLRGFLTERGWHVLSFEIVELWLPAMAAALALLGLRRATIARRNGRNEEV